MKAIKLQSNQQNLSWMDEQQVKQQRKASKELRSIRKSKKGIWLQAE